MWLPWRRGAPKIDQGGKGRHRAPDPGDFVPDQPTPREPVAPPVVIQPLNPPWIAPPPHLPSLVISTDPPPPGTIGLVFADGTEWLLAADDDRGASLRAMAAALSAAQTDTR